MKKQAKKKLTLQRESVRVLRTLLTEELVEVDGGEGPILKPRGLIGIDPGGSTARTDRTDC